MLVDEHKMEVTFGLDYVVVPGLMFQPEGEWHTRLELGKAMRDVLCLADLEKVTALDDVDPALLWQGNHIAELYQFTLVA